MTYAFFSSRDVWIDCYNLDYEPKMIITHIKPIYQYTISYLKAWMVK
jgi:hypothetical protein